MLSQKKFRRQEVKIFAVSMIDIEKTLKLKTKTNSQDKLSNHYHKFLEVFDQTETDKLLSLCESDKDHQIKLTLNENEKILNSS
jgi:hypothetical protein